MIVKITDRFDFLSFNIRIYNTFRNEKEKLYLEDKVKANAYGFIYLNMMLYLGI